MPGHPILERKLSIQKKKTDLVLLGNGTSHSETFKEKSLVFFLRTQKKYIHPKKEKQRKETKKQKNKLVKKKEPIGEEKKKKKKKKTERKNKSKDGGRIPQEKTKMV